MNDLSSLLHPKIARSGNAARIDRRVAPRRSAEVEYRSLFENAVCGIYRDELDGTPVRCNPALAALNGYASEAEYISAVRGAHGAWYVDPDRSAQFRQMMQGEGRVRDFVSEVYRHKSREKFWITENAWHVRDMDGNPIFIEGTIQDATERITTMAIVERQANVDSLTGVASRFKFMNALHEHTFDGAKGCALFSIDLDRFKEVNDTQGHAAGDYVLCRSAERLREIADGHGLVARLGGDEFALLLPGVIEGALLEDLAGKIISAMREPVQVNGQNLIVGASAGIASFPLHAENGEELLANADMALYCAKLAGRSGFCLFDADLRTANQRNKELEKELRDAIVGGELELHYQPIVDGSTGAVQCVEALMRWNHKSRGLIMPSQFIPLAEEAGLMTDLGNWAITRACEQAMVLPEHMEVAVNVSPNQFRSAGIISHLRSVLAETGLNPARLILEITESVILTSEMVAERVLSELQFLGVQLALDDFGTGYSSLSYLQRYAFSKVKIDRTFVAGMLEKKANLAIVRAVLGIGRDLGIGIVAEGVEKIEQAEALRDEGCVLMQGYLFGRPKPLNDIVCDLAVQELAAIQISAPETLEERRRA